MGSGATGGSSGDIIANIRAKFDPDSLKVGLDAVKVELQQLKLISNQAFATELFAKYKDDLRGLVVELERLGTIYQKETDSAKAMALTNEQIARNELALDKEVNQQQLNLLKLHFDETTRIANDEVKVYQKAHQEILNSQKQLFSSLSAGASGNIGGMMSGILNQISSGQMVAGTTLNGALGAGGAGIAGFLGLGAGMAPLIGQAQLLGQATISLGKAYLQAYQDSQKYLDNIRLIQKEMGTTADQTTKLTSFMGLTQNPNSPFSVIVFQQVAANLQNIADIEHGVGEATGMSAGQIQKMRDELSRLGVTIYNEKGGVKDITQFTIDLSKAIQGLDPARYAQAIQGIGGLFGKDFAAVVGTAPELLQQLADSAVHVTQEQLLQAEARKIAVIGAMNAEQQFNLEITNGLAPLDAQLQKVKQIVLTIAAMSVKEAGGFNPSLWLEQTGFNLITGILDPSGMKTKLDAYRASADSQGTATEVEKSLKRATDDYKEALRQLSFIVDVGKTAQEDYTKGLDATIKKLEAMKTTLGDVKTEFGNVTTELGNLKTVNDSAVTGFSTTVSNVLSGARGYESYYKNLRDQKETVQRLDTLSQQSVETYTITDPTTGETITPTSVKAAKTYIDQLAKNKAEDERAAWKIDAKNAIIDIREQNAKDKAALSATHTSSSSTTHVSATGKVTHTSSSTTSTTPGHDLTPAQALGYEQQREFLTQDPMIEYKQKVRQQKLDELAMKAGLPTGQVITESDITSSWGKRGLSQSEISQRQAALEQIQNLNFQDQDAQLKMMTQSASDFVKAIADQEVPLDQVNERQTKFQQASMLMATNLQGFAKAAGMFDSAGFVRSMGEAALAADLANKKFGEGPEAIQTYFDKITKFEGVFKDLTDVISGKEHLSIDQAIKAGIATADTGAAATAAAVAKRMAGFGEGEFTGTIAAGATAENVNKTFLERVKANQVGGAEVAQLVAKAQGIDVEKGIMGMYDKTFGAAKEKSDAILKNVNKEMTDITDKLYTLNVVLGDKSIQGIKDQLEAAGLTIDSRIAQAQVDKTKIAPGAQAAIDFVTRKAAAYGMDVTGATIPELQASLKEANVKLQSPNPTIPAAFFNNAPIGPGLTPQGWVSPGFGGSPNSLMPDWKTDSQSLIDDAQAAIKKAQETVVDSNPLLSKLLVNKSPAEIKVAQDQAMEVRKAIQIQIDNNPVFLRVIVQPYTPPAGPQPGLPGPLGINTNGNPAPIGPPLPPPEEYHVKGYGGSVRGGQAYWVGDRGGPELFWPGADGYIMDAFVSRKLAEQNNVRVNYRQPFIINTSTPQNTIQIDARGADSPATTAVLVRNAAETFMSNDPSVVARLAGRRRGYL